ncbi:MAG: PAS domain S-box protein [Bacteroidetes bacterium]|nr:MAG: PAS domain S-box protein [Bacteroidota bacterium]
MHNNPEKLRKKAIELLGQKAVQNNPEILENIDRLFGEYNIYKIELELQQEELSKTNQELELQNRKLDELFENAPVGYFILNSKGIITEVNKTAATLLQKSKEQIKNNLFNALIDPSSRDHFYFFWQKVMGEKCSASVEIAMIIEDTRYEHFLINSQPYKDETEGEWFVRLWATNVSELKETDVLRDSERRYRLLFKNMINGLMVLKPVFKKGKPVDFLFFRANASFEQITGISSQKMEGAPFMHIFPDAGAHILPMLQKTIEEKTNQNLENFYLHENLFVNIYTFIPELDYVAIIIEDVTAKMMAEKEKLQSHEMLQTIFKILPVGVTITDIEGNIIDCNPSSEELLGLKKEEHLVRSFAGSDWEILRTDMSPMPAAEFASVRALKENRIVENVEMGIVKSNKEITWINVSAAPIPLPDLGVAIVYSDITERVQAQEETEQKFKNIVQNSTDAIIIVNQAGSIIEWNKGCELIFGFRRKMALGQKIWDFIDSRTLPDATVSEKSLFDKKHIQQALQSGESVWFKKISETKIKDSWGKTRTIQSAAFPVKSGRLFLMGIVARDISEAKETETMLMIAKEQAEQASQVKSQFLANISHEIRTPLNAIMGFTEILKEFPVTDEKFKSLLSGIEKSSKALMGLINDILDLSRIEAGKMELNPTAFSIANLVEDVRQIFSLKAEQKGLQFNVTVHKQVPHIVLLDELRIRQILFNLAGNAVKFTETGSVDIDVMAKKSPELKDCIDLTIKVADTGPGINIKDLQTIFEPFFQKQPEGTLKQEGTGLGLAISQRFAEMMNGKITVNTQLNKGTEFSVHIPGIPSSESKNTIKIKAKQPVETPNALSTAESEKELPRMIMQELTDSLGSFQKAREFMSREVWSEYDKIADILGFDEVVKFSGILEEIAQNKKLRYLKAFSENLRKCAITFNVIEINKMLSSFEKIRE